jgi:hypothetical protein
MTFIKQLKSVWVTLAAVSVLACIQKESGKFATKAGENDVILYRKTLTTDNYLRTVTEAASREHKAYNKDKVAYVTFKAGGKASISYGGKLHKHYAVKILFGLQGSQIQNIFHGRYSAGSNQIKIKRIKYLSVRIQIWTAQRSIMRNIGKYNILYPL